MSKKLRLDNHQAPRRARLSGIVTTIVGMPR
jgi:hypothetical protein